MVMVMVTISNWFNKVCWNPPVGPAMNLVLHQATEKANEVSQRTVSDEEQEKAAVEQETFQRGQVVLFDSSCRVDSGQLSQARRDRRAILEHYRVLNEISVRSKLTKAKENAIRISM